VLHEEDIAPSLDIVGKCGDGSVEAVSSSSGKMYGVMWHPERAGAPRELDLAIMNELFGDRA
jgi:gamma-glutamyl-gamma-aminobutyrate hydrolase PuuD